ncbi:MAG: amidohydrolase family protein, partial [candidate division WOR-3 bacterium]|nr:amidohydrolase family protein [candidate division WOR-3 bacterium]
ILGVQPMFEIAWGQNEGMYAERLGERRRWTNPYRSILDAGIRIAAGSDAPITSPDPAEGIKAFLEHPVPEERITVDEAVRAYTCEGAYALHLEDRIGSIREGLQADLLVFDSDPFQTLDFHPSAVIRKGKLVAGSI